MEGAGFIGHHAFQGYGGAGFPHTDIDKLHRFTGFSIDYFPPDNTGLYR